MVWFRGYRLRLWLLPALSCTRLELCVSIGLSTHPFDGVEVFVGKSGARLVDVKSEEDTGWEAHERFGGV